MKRFPGKISACYNVKIIIKPMFADTSECHVKNYKTA